MLVTSTAFKNGEEIPEKYTCDGESINPPISLEGVPENTESLVLIVDDPDAPMGTWNHWLVYNISGGTKEITENAVPMGANVGTNDFGKMEYGGPCPPSGTHRYYFRVYALAIKLTLPPGAKRPDLDAAIQGQALTQAELMGTHSR